MRVMSTSRRMINGCPRLSWCLRCVELTVCGFRVVVVVIVVLAFNGRNARRNKDVDDGDLVIRINCCLNGNWREAGDSWLDSLLVGVGSGVCAVGTLISLNLKTVLEVFDTR